MKERSRTSFGMTDKGAVTLIEKSGAPADGGEPERRTFEVRHGVRTVGVYETEVEAIAVASALGSDVDE